LHKDDFGVLEMKPREDKLRIIKSDLQQEQNTFTVVGFEVLTVVVMRIAIFWDIAPCSPYINLRFRGTYRIHLQDPKSAEQETSVRAGGKAE
jgi:hypothetical protein